MTFHITNTDNPIDFPEERRQVICYFDCIFYGNRLHGDCRIPESEKCILNQRAKEGIERKKNKTKDLK